jgi:hypothetical protein
LQSVRADDQGRLVLPSQSTWGVGVIAPIPDYGRPGWQVCFETPSGERRYYSVLGELRAPTTLACDLARPPEHDVCDRVTTR